MKDKSFEVSGKSFRWSEYALIDGVVLPSKEAHLLQHDPWDPFRNNAGIYRTVHQPYVALLELARELKNFERPNFDSKTASIRRSQPTNAFVVGAQTPDQLVLNWSNQHGLLGLLPVLCGSIRPKINAYSSEDDEGTLHHYRSGGHWSSVETGLVAPFGTMEPDDAEPGVSWLNWFNNVYRDEPIESIKKFFPAQSPDEPFNPPRPNTMRFWHSYREPIEAVKHWCFRFAHFVDKASNWDPKGNSGVSETQVQLAYQFFNALSQAVGPSSSFNAKRNSVEEIRKSAGLLASYAQMFLWDRAENRRVLRCEVCDAYFVSNEFRAAYCSTSCRNTANSRRHRAKKGSAK